MRTSAKSDNEKKRERKKETKRSPVLSINPSRFSFSYCALDDLHKKIIKVYEQARVSQRRTTYVLRNRFKAKYVVKKVAPFNYLIFLSSFETIDFEKPFTKM